jgi:DNA-binding beta-propeller fold protein YncE
MMRRATIVVLLAALTACSGGASSTLPPSPQAPNRAVLARLTIKVPHASRSRHRREHYVSPATASLAYSVDGVAKTPVAISASSPNCKVNGPISYLQCSVNISIAPGTHVFSFTAKDASGRALSANTSISFNVVAGAANVIPVTLGGIATSFGVYPPTVLQVVATSGGGYTIYGKNALAFSIVPVDADGNAILGPGAPQPTVSMPPANMSMQTPAPSSPNLWTFTSTYVPADPKVAASSAIVISATPLPDSSGTTVSMSVPLALYVPWIYATSENGGDSIAVTDELGNVQSPGGAFPNLSSVNGLVYDPHDKLLYVENGGTHAITYYDTNGNYKGSFTGSDQPGGIAFDPNNDFLYVSYFDTNTISVYDEQGNQQTTSGSFPGTSFPLGIAYDSADREIFVANEGGNVTAYDEQGNQLSVSGGFPNASNPTGIAYNPLNGWLYVLNGSPNAVLGYDAQGNQQSLSGFSSGLGSSPTAIAYDPHNDWFYVGDCSGSGTPIRAYSSTGTQQASGGSFAAQVPGITVVP